MLGGYERLVGGVACGIGGGDMRGVVRNKCTSEKGYVCRVCVFVHRKKRRNGMAKTTIIYCIAELLVVYTAAGRAGGSARVGMPV